MQFHTRFGRSIHALALVHAQATEASVLSQIPLTVQAMETVVDLQREREAFRLWVGQTKADFVAVSARAAGEVDLDILSTRVLQVLAKADTDIQRGWNEQAKELARKAKAAEPSLQQLESPKLLCDPTMQQSLAAVAKQLHGSGILTEVADTLGVMKHFEERIPDVKKMLGRQALQQQKKLCKLTIGMNFAVEQLANFKPESPMDMKSRAIEVKSKLISKGLGGKACIGNPERRRLANLFKV
jgi:hypothetical protein